MANGKVNGKARVYFYIITVLVGMVLAAYGFILDAGANELEKKQDKDVAAAKEAVIIGKINAQDELIEEKLRNIEEGQKRIERLFEQHVRDN